MTTSRIVMPRGRVSIKIITFATWLASNRLPNSMASLSFSGGQSASNALMTGPGEMELPDPALENLPPDRLNKAVDRPFGRRVDRLPRCRKMGCQRTRDDDVTRPTLNHVRQHVVDILHNNVDVQVQHPVDGR